MILYDYILSADCYAIRLMAALSGVPLELQPVDVHPGQEQLSVAFRRINPAGTIPVLVDTALVLSEPAAILLHLASLRPGWQAERPMQAEWLARAAHFSDSLGSARLQAMLCQPGDLQACQAEGVMWLRVLESALRMRRFEDQVYLLGPRPGLADIALFPHVALAPDGGVSLDEYPSVRLWMRAIRSLPGFIEMPGIHRLHDLQPEPEPQVGRAWRS